MVLLTSDDENNIRIPLGVERLWGINFQLLSKKQFVRNIKKIQPFMQKQFNLCEMWIDNDL